MVCSRCFGIGAKGDVAMLPMVDMLNHSAEPHVSLGKATAYGTPTDATTAAVLCRCVSLKWRLLICFASEKSDQNTAEIDAH